jgi:hypothetical protein
MLGVARNLLDTDGANPSQARILSEMGHESGPRQLRTQRHGYAVEYVADPAAQVLDLRQIEALPAAALKPVSEPAGSP